MQSDKNKICNFAIVNLNYNDIKNILNIKNCIRIGNYEKFNDLKHLIFITLKGVVSTV